MKGMVSCQLSFSLQDRFVWRHLKAACVLCKRRLSDTNLQDNKPDSWNWSMTDKLRALQHVVVSEQEVSSLDKIRARLLSWCRQRLCPLIALMMSCLHLFCFSSSSPPGRDELVLLFLPPPASLQTINLNLGLLLSEFLVSSGVCGSWRCLFVNDSVILFPISCSRCRWIRRWSYKESSKRIQTSFLIPGSESRTEILLWVCDSLTSTESGQVKSHTLFNPAAARADLRSGFVALRAAKCEGVTQLEEFD